MKHKDDGTGAIFAANLNPLLDAADPDEHRLVHRLRRVKSERSRHLVLAPRAIGEKSAGREHHEDKKRNQAETKNFHGDFSRNSGPSAAEHTCQYVLSSIFIAPCPTP